MREDERKVSAAAVPIPGELIDSFNEMLKCVSDALPKDVPQGRQRFAACRRGKLPRAPRKMR